MRLSAGTRLTHFEIIEPVGAGGMGEVYRARDVKLGRDVAIKVIPDVLVSDARARQRLEAEARAVAALSHPNILVVHEFDHDAAMDVSFLAAELLEGDTLRGRIGGSRMAWRAAVEIGIAIADGLAAAHSKGIMHRDLKPENVFVTADERVKILDFGLAKAGIAIGSDADSPTLPMFDRSADRSGVVGTIRYMAPEQARGESLDTRCDLFAFGTLLFEMLEGQCPFDGESAAETLAAILTREPAFSADVRRSTPAELLRIVERCLAKKREERFQSAGDLAFDLRSLAGGPSQRPDVVESIAVLPFDNSSGDPNTDYISDGLTESIINRLSLLPSLRVTARSTVFRFRGKDVDPLQTGRALGVRAVLTGGVHQRQDRLTVHAELADVASGAQLWGERYQRTSADLLDVEDTIAREITERLRLHLSPNIENTRHAPMNTEAYDAYLKGRFWWAKRTEHGLYRGLDYFREAVDADPRYALAWVGLADSYYVLGFYGHLPPGDALRKSEAAARKALELDPHMAEAHAALGYSLHNYRWDWARASESYRRALALHPRYTMGHVYYANHLAALRRIPEALSHASTAFELEPFSVLTNTALAWTLYYGREYGRAVAQFEKTLILDEHFGLAHLWMAGACRELGALDEALRHAEAPAALSVARVEAESAQAIVHASAGRPERARAILQSLQRMVRDRFVQPYELATIHVSLGDTGAALAALEDAYAIRSHRLSYAQVDPKVDPLRSEARFQELIKRMEFPER